MEKRVDGPLVAEELEGHCTDYCIKHKDKSMTNERIMLRLTQTPTKIHNLMIEGAVDGG